MKCPLPNWNKNFESLLAALLFAGVSWLAIRVLRRQVHEATAPRWLVLATRQVAAQPVYAVVQTTALALVMADKRERGLFRDV